MNRKLLIFSIVALLGLVADQVTKWWVRVSPAVNEPGGIKVIPHFFSIVHAENPGAAFGMLGNLSEGWRVGIFVVFTLIAVGIVADMYRKLPATDWFLATTLGLILSGALGNLVDRVYKPLFGVPNHRGELEYGATVTDFLRFYTDDPEWAAFFIKWFGMAEYPAFNVADANLVVGVGMFLVHYLFVEGREKAQESADQAQGSDVAPEASAPEPGPAAESSDSEPSEPERASP